MQTGKRHMLRRSRERRRVPSTGEKDSSMVLHCCKYLLLAIMLTAVAMILLHVQRMHAVLNQHVEIDGHAHDTLTINKINSGIDDRGISIDGGRSGDGGSSSSSSSSGGTSSSSNTDGVHFPKCRFNIAPKCQLAENLKYWKEPPDCLR